METPFGTLLIDFIVIDNFEKAKAFQTDHFDWDKNQSRKMKEAMAALAHLLLAVPETQLKHSPYFHKYEEMSYCPAHVFHILRDVYNYHGLTRLHNLYQAIALLHVERLQNFRFRFEKYEPNALYRRNYQ